MSGNEPDCDCSKCGCSLESDAYARGKADGMAEAEANVVAFLRGYIPQSIDVDRNGYANPSDIADALERKEHRK